MDKIAKGRQHREHMGMQVHPITLAFRGADAGLEAPFREYYFENGQQPVRIAMIVGTILLAAYAMVDALFVPERKYLFWALRWGLECPVALSVLAFTYSRYAARYMQPALSVATMIAGLTFIAMYLLAPAPKAHIYLQGLVQLLIAIYTLLRFRFIWATATFATLLLIFFTVGIFGFELPRDRLGSAGAFLFGINLLGMMAGYTIERFTRKNFYLSRHLETKKRRLSVALRFLGQRVEKRTAELTQANQQLQSEVMLRKTIEKAYRESKRRYQRMVNNVTDYLVVHDLDGKILEGNYRMITGLDYSHKEIVGMNLKDLISAKGQPFFSGYLDRLRTNKKDAGKIGLVAKNGQLRVMEYSSVVGPSSRGGMVVYSLSRDITERHRTEKALAESQARFKDIFGTAAAGMLIVKEQTQQVIEVNPAAAQMLGEPIEKIQGRSLDGVISITGIDFHKTGSRAYADPVECDLVRDGQDTIPILKTMQPMQFNGEPHWLISFVSIHKIKEAEAARREAETQLTRSQHLQAIGTLAGGIAHDFNNILYGVIGYTQLALDDAPEGSLLRDNLTEVLQGSRRAKELIAQILAFSRQEESESKPIQPAPLIKEALKLLRASIPSSVEIQANIVPDTHTILANPTQIHQVIMNLCTNATHAMQARGGLLRVVLENFHLTSGEVFFNGPLAPGRYVRLMVADNGLGMAPQVIDRIFEPFFTTKTQGEGSGMGLSVVLGVVQAHQGGIRVQSEPGQGTCFEILLPVAARAEAKEEKEEQPIPGGDESILLVDDERAIIQMGRQMLSKLGYKVTTYQDPGEALERFRREPQSFDLVITDLTMPKLKGTEMAEAMLGIKPELPVILCTGYGDQITSEQIARIGIRELLLKPILRESLAVTIRQALTSN
jgi:PAS domain S-box-containing protein